MTAQFIPDVIGQVVTDTAMALGRNIHYKYGHLTEVTKRLVMDGQSPKIEKRVKYPLVWLVMDFQEQVQQQQILLPDLQIIIATNTKADYTMQQRRDETFLPVLYPIYTELLKQLYRSNMNQYPNAAGHTKVDRPYWGGQEQGNGQANIFNDFIDAIQIKNLNLKIKTIC